MTCCFAGLFRWFVGLSLDDQVWHATTFTHNRDRLISSNIVDELFGLIKQQAAAKKLLSQDHFSVDGHPEILSLIKKDLVNTSLKPVGRAGLTVESVFRCLLLKQRFGLTYERLAFHLADSISYRSFARLPPNVAPKKSCLQSTIRSIEPETLEAVYNMLSIDWLEQGYLCLDKLRIDSTVVASNIAPPSDSQILNDGVRVLSRYLTKSGDVTGEKIRFTDQRKSSKSLAFRIFNAKNAGKEVLYSDLLKVVRIVLKQVDRALLQNNVDCSPTPSSKENVTKGRALGIQHVVFHKRVGISYLAMGVKKKTFKQLRNFRAGVEGNISELKRTFGAGKATWKGHEGFKAYVWSSVISYNLVRMARMQSG